MHRWHEFYLRLRYQWQLHFLLPLLLFIPLFIVFWRDPFHTQMESGEPVIAEITNLGVGWSSYQGRTPGLRISAKTEDGLRGTRIVLPADVEGCRIGDPVRAEQKGLKLYLYPAPCE